MTILSQASCRRLQQLPKTQSVWEGDRRSLSQNLASTLGIEASGMQGDCILWVDGGEGLVRGIDVVPADTGHEAIVRTLLQAMERPHGAIPPSRPQKIVVRDREVQFFLRGALQNLDVSIEYAADLPLIDEVFHGLQKHVSDFQVPPLPDDYVEPLMDKAEDLWELAPWEILDEQQIISVDLNRWDIGTVYISVLGMMGMEFGLLMYRSLDSLKQFRQRVLRADQSPKQMQQAFLEQDCIFLTFDLVDDEASEMPEIGFEPHNLDLKNWLEGFTADEDREPSFGNIHPLEGLRTHLESEEAIATLVILDSFLRFLRRYQDELDQDELPALKHRYRIPNPEPEASPKTVSVTVQTLPEIAQELMDMTDEEEATDEPSLQPPVLQDDFVPENSIVKFSVLPWDWIEILKLKRTSYFPLKPQVPQRGEGMPVIMIHTSQPKGADLIDSIQAANGLQAVCFNLGEDPFNQEEYDLALVQSQDGLFHLLCEYLRDNPRYLQQRQQWEKHCHLLERRCGLAIAKGVTGKNRGNPQLRDIMAFYEVHYADPETLGLSPLRLQLAIDWLS
jgi:hypothetical protein